MKFLVDAQLPRGLCGWLAVRGHDAVHVADVMAGDASDTAIGRHASAGGMIVVTKDEDFSAQAAALGHRVLWLRCGNLRNALLYNWLHVRWPDVEPGLLSGDMVVEVR